MFTSPQDGLRVPSQAFVYNLVMLTIKPPVIALCCLTICAGLSSAQQRSASPDSSAQTAAERGMSLASSGHCLEAIPLLRKSIRQVTNKDLQKKIGLTGITCAMTHNAPNDVLPFLEVLLHEFPRDPEVLYTATRVFSDLSLSTSQQLMREAPFSYQVHELNAEALEAQGKWDEAAAEYRKIIELNPLLPSIHARLGRVLLAPQQPTPEAVAQAKKCFEDELAIDPSNATAEFALGELTKNEGDFAAAIRHYTRATKLDVGFAEAYLGLGSALVASKQFAEAIVPLEKYEKLAPDSPSGHHQLALAYAGVGRKEDANREAALQRETAQRLEQIKRRVAEGLEGQHPPQ